MGTLTRLGALVAAVALSGCGGDSSPPQLIDDSQAGEVPAALEELDDAVLTRTAVKEETAFHESELRACGVTFDSGMRTMVERTGLHGSSLTMRSGRLILGCDKIPEPQTAQDRDLPYGGIWCAGPNGRLDQGKLNDPRLNLCQNTSGDITAFVWVDPRPGTKWVVVSDAGHREVYEVASRLPVRVTTTDGAELDRSRASFDIEEYAADGTKLRGYVLEAAVAG